MVFLGCHTPQSGIDCLFLSSQCLRNSGGSIRTERYLHPIAGVAAAEMPPHIDNDNVISSGLRCRKFDWRTAIVNLLTNLLDDQ